MAPELIRSIDPPPGVVAVTVPSPLLDESGFHWTDGPTVPWGENDKVTAWVPTPIAWVLDRLDADQELARAGDDPIELVRGDARLLVREFDLIPIPAELPRSHHANHARLVLRGPHRHRGRTQGAGHARDRARVLGAVERADRFRDLLFMAARHGVHVPRLAPHLAGLAPQLGSSHACERALSLCLVHGVAKFALFLELLLVLLRAQRAEPGPEPWQQWPTPLAAVVLGFVGGERALGHPAVLERTRHA